MKDTIVEEVRAAREHIARECGYDSKKILEHAHQVAARIPGFHFITADELREKKSSARSVRLLPKNQTRD